MFLIGVRQGDASLAHTMPIPGEMTVKSPVTARVQEPRRTVALNILKQLAADWKIGSSRPGC
jgi:hypothetical protein